MKLKSLLVIICFFILQLSMSANASDINQIIRNGQLEALSKEPISLLSYNYRDNLGRNALAIALASNQNEIAKYLISRGIGINVRDYVGKTPLMLASIDKNNKELIEMLLVAGASTVMKDKYGRDLIFYANQSNSSEMVSMLKGEMSKAATPLSTDLDRLRQILLKINHKDLIDFFQRFKTLDLKIDNKSLVEFLIENGLLEKWNPSIFVEFGVNFNDSVSIYKCIESKNNVLIDFLLNQKVSLGKRGSDGLSVLALSLNLGIQDDILNRIFDQMVSYDYVDNLGNNLLFYSIKAKNKSITLKLIEKGISLNQFNKNFETPLSVAISEKGNNEIVTQVIKENKIDFNVKDTQGNALLVNLAKNYPEIYKKERNNIINKGGKVNVPDVAGKSSDQVLVESDPGIMQDQDLSKLNPDTLPSLTPLVLKQVSDEGFRTPSRKTNDSKIYDVDFSGDRVLDKFLENSFQNYIVSQRFQFKEYLVDKYKLVNSDIENEQALRDKLAELAKNNAELQDVNNQISQKKLSYNLLVNKSKEQSLDDERNLSLLNKVGSELRDAVAQFSEKISGISKDLESFGKRKDELEKAILKFKSAKGDIYDLIKEEKTRIQVNKDSYQVAISESIFRYNSEVISERAYLTQIEQELADLQSKNFEIVNEKNKIETTVNNNLMTIERDRASIISDVHKLVHLNDVAKCPYLAEIDKLEKQNKIFTERSRSLSQSLNTYNSKINQAEKAKAQAANFYQRTLLEKSRERDGRKFLLDKFLSDEIDKSERQIVSLELNNREYYKQLISEINNEKAELEAAYGNLDTLEDSWKLISNLSISINSGLSSVNESFICAGIVLGLDYCVVKNRKTIEDANFKDLVPFLDTIGKKLLSYKKIEHIYEYSDKTEDELRSMSEDIVRLGVEQDRLKEEGTSLQEQINEEKQKNNSAQETELKKFVDLEFELIEHSLFQNFSSEADEFFNKDLRDRIIKKLGISLDDSFFNYLSKKQQVQSDFAPIISTIDPYTTKEIRSLVSEEKRMALIQWHRLITKNSTFQGKIFDKKFEHLFANAILSNVEIKIVQDSKQANSLKIITKDGSFVLDEFGAVSEIKSNDFFKFELLSSGEKRKRIEDLLKEFQETIGGRLTKEQLQNDFGINLILNMIKIADRLDSAEMAADILEVAEIGIRTGLVLSGAGEVTVALTSGISCAVEIYRTSMLNVKLDLVRFASVAIKCLTTNARMQSQLERVTPFMSQIRSFFNKYITTTFTKLNDLEKSALNELAMSLSGFIYDKAIFSRLGEVVHKLSKQYSQIAMINSSILTRKSVLGELELKIIENYSITLQDRESIVLYKPLTMYAYHTMATEFYTYENIFDSQNYSFEAFKESLLPAKSLINVSVVRLNPSEKFIRGNYNGVDVFLRSKE